MVKEKKGEKNPYPYPIADLNIAEQSFCVQVGVDFYIMDGVMVFPPEIINDVRDAIVKELRDMLENGTEEEKNDARYAFASFYVVPLRVH